MGDEVVDALGQLVEALNRSSTRIEQAVAKAEILTREHGRGRPWGDIIRSDERPLIIELIGQNLDELYTSGGRLRRALARALYEEGMSMEQIARTFGVTRQRVSALLRSTGAEVVESGQGL